MPLRLPLPVLLTLFVAAVVVLIALGVWQLERNEWRNHLVAERNARLEQGHLALDEIRAVPLDDVDFRLLSVEGTWDHERTMLVANRIRYRTRGEEVVTPLLPAAGGPAILVNRGWVPEQMRDEVLDRLRQEDTGRVSVEGLVRYHPDLQARRTPQGTWSDIAPVAMADSLPYAAQPWFVIEGELIEPNAPPPPHLPAQGFLPYESHVPHLEYAFTWFGIAGVLVVFAVIHLVIAPRRNRHPRPGRPDADPPRAERAPEDLRAPAP